MQARLRLNDRMSKKTKDNIRQFCSDTMREQQRTHSRRMIKIFCVVLHQVFGFGAERCLKVINAIDELSEERDRDEVFWNHIDRTLQQMGLNFPQEDYEVMDR